MLIVSHIVFNSDNFSHDIEQLLLMQDKLYNEHYKKINDNINDSKKLSEICKVDVNSSIRKELKKYMKNLELKKRFNGINFKEIFPTDKLLNGSNPSTEKALYNAMKFQCICYLDEFLKVDKDKRIYMLKLFCIKLQEYINNSMTYNYEVNENKKIEYNPFYLSRINQLASLAQQRIFEENTLYVCFYEKNELINMDIHSVGEKDKRLNVLSKERLTSDELENYIQKFITVNNTNPTINELSSFISAEICMDHKNDNDASYSKYLPSDSVIRYYIKKYDLYSKIKVLNRGPKRQKQQSDASAIKTKQS